MTRVTLRCDVSWIERHVEREPSRGGYERNHLSMFSAICFLSYEATIYDAGHHNFEFPPTIPQNIWQLFFSLSLIPYLVRTRVIHPTGYM